MYNYHIFFRLTMFSSSTNGSSAAKCFTKLVANFIYLPFGVGQVAYNVLIIK